MIDVTKMTLDEVLRQLAPLTTKPLDNYGWVECLDNVCQIEQSIDQKALDQETIQKVQAAFDAYLDSMVQHGFDVNKTFSWPDYKPIHLVLSHQCSVILRSLIKKGADVNANTKENEFGVSALWYASFYGKVENAKILIDNGADVNKGENGDYPIHVASSLDMWSFLLLNGAKKPEEEWPHPAYKNETAGLHGLLFSWERTDRIASKIEQKSKKEMLKDS